VPKSKKQSRAKLLLSLRDFLACKKDDIYLNDCCNYLVKQIPVAVKFMAQVCVA
jgi:hypothetical protein